MNAENEGLYFGVGLDTQQLQNDAKTATEILSGIGEEAAQQTHTIEQLLTHIPAVDIKVVDNASSELDAISAGLQQVDHVIGANKQAIAELQAADKQLAEELGKVSQSNQEEVTAMQRSREAISENIKLREQMIQAAEEAKSQLEQLQQAHADEAASNEKATESDKQNIEQKKTLMQEIRELRNAMEQYVLENGTDQTEEYRQMAEELGRLRDIRGDIQSQGSVLSNDEAKIQGVISGLQGVTGAFGVAQGAVALFGSENEELNKIMMRVQAVMSITMGLQQIQQVLNKDSAFQLVVVNGLKELWNKISLDGAAATEAENTAIAENTAAKETNNVATTTNVAATEADTVAQTANNASKEQGTVATGANSAATKGATVATEASTTSTKANTVATNAQTVATKGASLATKALRVAIFSLGIPLLIAGIVKLIGWLKDWFTATDEETKANQRLKESVKAAQEEAAQSYAKTSTSIEFLTNRVKNFNGSQREEKELIKECNDKFGESLGYYYDIATWKQKLMSLSKIYQAQLYAEAMTQALMNEYAKAYVETIKGNDVKANERLMASLQEKIDYWQKEVQFYKDFIDWDLGTSGGKGVKRPDTPKSPTRTTRSSTPKSTTPKAPKTPRVSTPKPADQFDWEKAKREQENAEKDYIDAVQSFVDEANGIVGNMELEAVGYGLSYDLQKVDKEMQDSLSELNDKLKALAEKRQETWKAEYMSKKGATENDWYKSAKGKMSVDDIINEMLDSNEVVAGTDKTIKQWFDAAEQAITDGAMQQKADLKKKYYDEIIGEYGDFWQSYLKMNDDWTKKIMDAQNDMRSAGMPQSVQDKVLEKLQAAQKEALSKLHADHFKETINWDEVVGNVSGQSMESLQRNIDRIKAYIKEELEHETIAEPDLKVFTEAIAKLEMEMEKRNPFLAFNNAVSELSSAKTEYLADLAEMRRGAEELKAAEDALAEATRNRQTAESVRDEAGETSGEFSLAYSNANADVVVAVQKEEEARKRLQKVKEQNLQRESKYIQSSNQLSKAYENFSEKCKKMSDVVGRVGSAFQKMGSRAKSLAAVFSDNLAESLGKVLDFTGEIIDATQESLNAIGTLVPNITSTIKSTTESASAGMQASATAASTAIQTVEKASAVLAIIGAAIQLATAVANLFNNDDKKQKEIERLQERIDQLQWELDNRDIVRMQERYGKSIEIVNRALDDSRRKIEEEYKSLGKVRTIWQAIAREREIQQKAYAESIEKIAHAYANMEYTAGKALGGAKYEDAQAQLRNIAEQQLLIQQQIDKENSKKKTDNGKIKDWEQKIEELGAEALAIINDMVEDIIGGTSSDIANELAEGFFEAFAAGEDAAEAWGKKVDEIVGDILKRMLVNKFLEEPLGDIFNKYKSKWFPDGQFAGIQAVIDSMSQFRADINGTYNAFSDIMAQVPEDLHELFTDVDAERSAVEKGIAQASQDSVDELNGRATAIQGHTYSINENTKLLVSTSSSILQSVLNIEGNTDMLNIKVDRLESDMRAMRSDINDMATRGITIKR